MNTRQLVAGISLALLLFLGCHAAFGQGAVTGSITGVVVDATGAIVPNAKITAVQQGTNTTYSTTSTDSGNFILPKAAPGTYDVTVEAGNFRNVRMTGVQVNVNRETGLGRVMMEIGTKSEVVEVEGAAPLIEAQPSQLSMVFDEKKVADLPLGRGMDQLTLYLPGVSTAGSVGRGNNNGALFSANGQRPRSNNFQIDGQGMNDPSVTGPAIFLQNNDIVAEYQVMTNYDAQYGRNTGSQVNVVTKSGTNSFHGTAFEQWRGSRFDSLANQDKNPVFGFCAPGETEGCDTPVVPRFVQNTFGFTVGGPILKDKAWFFGSGLWDRQRETGSPTTSGTQVTLTPNGVNQLAAAFPNSVATSYFKSKWSPLSTPGNPVVTPSTTICVGGTGTDCTGGTALEAGQLKRTLGSVANTRQFTARGDVQLTDKDRVFARYLIDDEISTNLDVGDGISGQNGFFYDVPSRGQQFGAEWTRQFSNRLVNSVRFNWTKLSVLFQGGTTGCTKDDFENCPTMITFNDVRQMGLGFYNAMPQGRTNGTYEITDNANLTIGKHNFKFGGYWNHQSPETPFLPNYNGVWSFPDFTSFVNNSPSSLAGVNGNPNIKYKETDMAFYFQDDIRLTPTFSIQAGLRWEWYQNTINQIHDMTVAQQTGPDPFWNTSLPLDLTTIHSVPEDRNNFGPVVGFAWNARNKVTVRGGFRVAFDPAYYNILLNVATSAPVVNSITLRVSNGDVVPGLPTGGDFSGVGTRPAFSDYLPVGTNPGLRTQSLVTDNFHNPYSEQWNFGVQYEISPKMVTEFRYLGNHSVGLYQNLNGNIALNPFINNGWSSVIPSGLTPCTTAGAPGVNLGYVDCNRRNVNLRTNTASSNYHGMQSRFDVRSWHGLTTTVSYTWAHAIDTASDIYSTTGAGMLNIPQNPFDPGNGERGNSNFDYRHTMGLQFVYELPWFKQQQGLLGRALGGWQMNILHRYASGQPYTLLQTRGGAYGNSSVDFCDPSSLFSSTTSACRPILNNPSAPFNSIGYISAINAGVPTVNNMAGGTLSSITDAHWLVNSPLAAQYFGSPYTGVGRNTLTGMTTNNTNLAVQKTFKITERLNFQFNATAFNVFNRMFLGVPGNNIMRPTTSFNNWYYNNSGGGNATTLDNGLSRRRLQFGGKITF